LDSLAGRNDSVCLVDCRRRPPPRRRDVARCSSPPTPRRRMIESSRHENLFSTGGRSRATPRALRYGTTHKAIGSAVPGNHLNLPTAYYNCIKSGLATDWFLAVTKATHHDPTTGNATSPAPALSSLDLGSNMFLGLELRHGTQRFLCATKYWIMALEGKKVFTVRLHGRGGGSATREGVKERRTIGRSCYVAGAIAKYAEGRTNSRFIGVASLGEFRI
jgi:hypothetical protein